MSEEPQLTKPWLVAVWPGMGHVAISAGYYLMAKLGMHVMAEFSQRELFDVEHVEVKNGLIQTGRLPRSRLFLWSDPQKVHDIIVFIGEAQPPIGKYAFCHGLIEYARRLGVERVFTFAAMATQMHPEHEARAFCAATDEALLAELRQLDLETLEDGHIGGLNGVLLGAAAEAKLPGACLLGEMPHIFAQLPFPKASLAVLQAFVRMAHVEIDLAELSEQSAEMSQKLGELLSRVEHEMDERPEAEDESLGVLPAAESALDPADERRIEDLLAQAQSDRSKAYELKKELDRLDAFGLYEDRFLDLFKKTE